MIKHEDIDDGPLYSKLHKVSCCGSLCPPCNFLFHSCRKAVSRSKRRYQIDGFDLDLVYLSERIIVHGFPAVGIEHIYRNPRYEIKRLLDTNHPNKYKMFNFCCEPGRGYSPDVYEGRVERYPFKDHNTPPLQTMVAFANSAKKWLDSDPENVCSMHCKAGKGRAGLMSCVLLVRTGIAASAKDAIAIYDTERVVNMKGLTVTSQRKYVYFYEELWRKFWNVSGNIGDISAEEEASTEKYTIPEEPSITIFGVELLNTPENILNKVRIKIFQGTNFTPQLRFDTGKTFIGSLAIDSFANVKGNFKVSIETKKGFFGKTIKVLELWHNTLFMDTNVDYYDFPANQLDIKRAYRKTLGENVTIRLLLTRESNGTTVPIESDGYGKVTDLEHLELDSKDTI